MGCGVSEPLPVKPDAKPTPPIEKPKEVVTIDKITPITEMGAPQLQQYEFKEILGKGHFAKVRRCIQKSTGKEFAVKIIDKKDMVKNAATVKAEIEVLKAVGKHPNIVALVDNFEGEDEYYIVMELCKGGDLFTKIVSEGKYTEKRAARICRQLATALQCIHKAGVAHRDLKPENILLSHDGHEDQIKVADFGLSKLMKMQQPQMRTVCGTWAYCAPEVISRKPYTQAVDNWTLGVLMFILLSGYHPFDVYGEMPEPQLLKKIKDCDYDFDDDVWDHVSPTAKQLIRGLLVLDPEKRMSLDQYLTSPWILGEGVKDKPLKIVVERLSKFNDARKKFRALVLAKLVAGKFRASISRERTPNQSISIHKLWTPGSTGSPPELSRTDFTRSPVSGPQSPAPMSRGDSHDTGIVLPNQANVDNFSLTSSMSGKHQRVEIAPELVAHAQANQQRRRQAEHDRDRPDRSTERKREVEPDG